MATANNPHTTAQVFTGLSRQAQAAIGRFGCELRLDTGAVLTQPCVRTRQVIVMLEGSAVASEDAHMVERFGPGDAIGVRSCLSGAPTTATVTAETPVRVLVFDVRAFMSVLYAAPEIERRLTTPAGRPDGRPYR